MDVWTHLDEDIKVDQSLLSTDTPNSVIVTKAECVLSDFVAREDVVSLALVLALEDDAV